MNLSKTQLEGIAKDMPNTLSLSVMKRYMNDRELTTFYDLYRKNRMRGVSFNRFDFLEREVTKEEQKMLSDYFNNDVTTEELTQKYGKSYAYKIRGIAMRVLYQK